MGSGGFPQKPKIFFKIKRIEGFFFKSRFVMALHISHVGYVMPMLGGRTGGFVAILAISGITLTVRACPQLCIVS